MLRSIIESAKQKIESVSNSNELQQVKVEFLGKQSAIIHEMKKIALLDLVERKALGQEINQVKEQIQALIEEKQYVLEDKEQKVGSY